MPQCIAQQDQTTWLNTMTKCTQKRCTRHFGIICTHHQWLTQLSCLSAGFSPDVIKHYIPYCSRSVLAKAQLYRWIRNVTGRTWLVDVGDANELLHLSEASLVEGYASVGVTYKAPTCLSNSVSASREAFHHVLASCSFTSTTRHIGNAARPWEYSGSRRSMIALDFETVGYDSTGRTISNGDYFDKKCFCGTFTTDSTNEPCLGDPRQIDLTRALLWKNATCGPKYLPDNWTEKLKTTQFGFIPVGKWYWPSCVMDMPKQVVQLADKCETDACKLDSAGYCEVTRAVDRSCFCRDITYDSCGGACRVFEGRIGYVKWLHGVCGSVQDWHGLPDNWRQLAAPSRLEMIPWRWSVKPSTNATETCVANEWKLGSFALVNVATLLAVFLGSKIGVRRIVRGFVWHPRSSSWVSTGLLIAAIQLLGHWFNAIIVHKTPGYENVPISQLLLLWISIPRLSWLPILLIGVQPFVAINLSAAAPSLFAETILQLLSSYYMIQAVKYGLEHNLYIDDLENVGSGGRAGIMYTGALMWVITIAATVVYCILATRRWIGSSGADLPKWQGSRQAVNIVEEVILWFSPHDTRVQRKLDSHLMHKSSVLGETTRIRIEAGKHPVYGTFPSEEPPTTGLHHQEYAELYAVTVTILFLLWIAQWLFWGGFIGLSGDEYVSCHIPLKID